MKKLFALSAVLVFSWIGSARADSVTATGKDAITLIEALTAANLISPPKADLPDYPFSVAAISCTYDIHTPTSFRENFSCTSGGTDVVQSAFLVSALENAIGDSDAFEDAAAGRVSLSVSSVKCDLNHATADASCTLTN